MSGDKTQPLDPSESCEHVIEFDDLNHDESEIPLKCSKCGEELELVASKHIAEMKRLSDELVRELLALRSRPTLAPQGLPPAGLPEWFAKPQSILISWTSLTTTMRP